MKALAFSIPPGALYQNLCPSHTLLTKPYFLSSVGPLTDVEGFWNGYIERMLLRLLNL